LSYAQERHDAEQFAIWDHVRRCRLDLADAEKALKFAENAPVSRWGHVTLRQREADVTLAERTLLVAIRAAFAAGLVDEFGVERAA
jgi:hypothetical protein